MKYLSTIFQTAIQRLALTCYLLASSSPVFAMPASPFGFQEGQPDGTDIHVHLEGDEHFHWLADHRGFTIVKDRDWFVYGKRDKAGRIAPTSHRVGKSDPARAGLKPRQLPDPAFQEGPMQANGSASSTTSSASIIQGTLPNLVVLLRFSDHATRSLPSENDIDILMNAPGGHSTLAPTGSVRDVYLENSYNQLSIESTVAYWVTLPNTESYYANGNSGMTTRTHEALRYALDTLDADPNINFTDFDHDGDGQIDAITFLHSGYAAEWGGTSADGASYIDRIWSHKWGIAGGWASTEGVNVSSYHISPAIWGKSGSTIGRIGVICHELGHFLGLPDLYDGNDSDGDGKVGNGIGSFGLMANSWGFDNSQRYPPNMCAWSKIQLGWITPTVIQSGGTYSLPQMETHAAAYRIDLGYNTGEYLLVENRQPVGTDAILPQGGLAIYHIDETAIGVHEGYPGQTGWPENGNHYRVALLQADGAYELERGIDRGDAGDVYHGNGVSELGPNTVPSTDGYQDGNIVVTNNRLTNISTSGSTMTFDFQVVGSALPPAAPSNLAANAVSYDQVTLTWTDQASNETGTRVERSNGGSWTEVATLSANVTNYNDHGLNASSNYSYRVRAFNLGGNSAYSNTASTTTHDPPPPPQAPSELVAVPISDQQINLSWSDNASDEDGYLVERSLDTVVWETAAATLSANTQIYQDTELNAHTTYYYRVSAFNSVGNSSVVEASAQTEEAPPYEYTLADQDWGVAGTISGTFARTHEGDGQAQTITERESGGRKSSRYSYLDHRWRFSNVRGGLSVTLFADVSVPSNNEQDDFELQYSLNGGTSWNAFNPACIVINGTPGGQMIAASLPDTARGEIHVRVIDTDTTTGNRALDSVAIDYLAIRTDIDPDDFPPAAPSDVTAQPLAPTAIHIAWADQSSNELGFELWRSTDNTNWISVGTLAMNSASFTDETAAPATTYAYRVSSFTPSFEAFSDASNEVSTPDGIALTHLSGGKQKGKIYVDLSWEGGGSLSTIEVYSSVNGSAFTQVASTANDGAHRHSTNLKGGQVLRYRLQSPDGSISSNELTISF